MTGELVFGYLQHHGYWDTAAAVARDVLGGAAAVSQQDVQNMQAGCGCRCWVLGGLMPDVAGCSCVSWLLYEDVAGGLDTYVERMINEWIDEVIANC